MSTNISEEDILVGIDLGTCNIIVEMYTGKNIEIIKYKEQLSFPSNIFFDNDNINIIDNNDINKQLDKYNDNIIYYPKLLIGLDYEELTQKDFFKNLFYEISEMNGIPKIKIKINEKVMYYSAEELLSFVFKELKNITENYILKLYKNFKIKKFYITVPKFFSDEQKKSVKSSALLAGIDNFDIIDEPFAEIIGYAIGYNLMNGKEKFNNIINDSINSTVIMEESRQKDFMVFDLGGGKTDINIYNIKINNEGNPELKILLTDCDMDLGGIYFDNQLMDYCIKEFSNKYSLKEEDIRKNKKSLLNLKLKCEEIKTKFNDDNKMDEEIIDIPNFFENNNLLIKLSKIEFDKICKRLYIKIKNLVNGSFKRINKKLDELDEMILIGKGTKISGVKNIFFDLFGKNKVKCDFNLENIIPICTIIKSIQIEENCEINFLTEYFTSEILGISSNNNLQNNPEKNHLMIPLVKKYQKLPLCNRKAFYTTLTENDNIIIIEILEGNNKKIGDLKIKGLNKVGPINYIIEFSIDVYGKLIASYYYDDKKGEKQIAYLDLVTINKEEKKIFKHKKKKIQNLKSMNRLFKILTQNYLEKIEENKEEINLKLTYQNSIFNSKIEQNNTIEIRNEINLNKKNSQSNKNNNISKIEEKKVIIEKLDDINFNSKNNVNKRQSNFEKKKKEKTIERINEINLNVKSNKKEEIINKGKNQKRDKSKNKNELKTNMHFEYINAPIKNYQNENYKNNNIIPNSKSKEKTKTTERVIRNIDNNMEDDLILKKKYEDDINKKNHPNSLNNKNVYNLMNNRDNNEYENIFETEKINFNTINNNIRKGEGIIQLIKEYKDNKIEIRKELLKNINSFIACLGPPGAGKSTFCSNYYKCLFKVKNDYFESSDENLTFTKGIWIISDNERRKIPIMIKKDLLDVEGFQVDDVKCWKYVMIIAFLSTDLLILNRNSRFDDVKKMLRIIENSLKRMEDKKIPRILKNIYIQTTSKKPKNTIEQLIDNFISNKELFRGINFAYIYLPDLKNELEESNNDLMRIPKYKENFELILQRLSNSNLLKNSVSSLMEYIDFFNCTINGSSGFNAQTIFKDIESDFNGVYSRYEKKLKNELFKKADILIKVQNLKETFDDFINKQIGLIFIFQINNDDFTFYGSCKDFNNYYEQLKAKKSFRLNPKDIFFDIYQAQMKELEIKEKKRRFEEEQKIREAEMQRKREEEKKRIEEEEKRIKQEREKRRLAEQMEKARDEATRKQREEQRRKEEQEENRKLELLRKQSLEAQKREEQEARRKMEEQKRKIEEEEKINNLYNNKIKEINNYFSKLKFYETISSTYNLKLNIYTTQTNLKNEYEKKLREHYDNKIKEKKKDWEDQIERSKWKVRVQACGEMRCKNGCELIDNVTCKKCDQNLFWVDSDEKYAICKGCNKDIAVRKLSGKIDCKGCGAECLCTVKWIKGYKP